MLETAVLITQVLLALGAAGAVYRVYKGPSVLDRVISLDVMLIIVASMMIVDMVEKDHQDFVLFVVVTAVIGFLGAVAIARYVVVRSPEEASSAGPGQDPTQSTDAVAPMETEAALGDPVAPLAPPPGPEMPGIGVQEDESTSWFSALTRSGFTPRSRDADRAGDDQSGAEQPGVAQSDADEPGADRPDAGRQEDRDA